MAASRKCQLTLGRGTRSTHGERVVCFQNVQELCHRIANQRPGIEGWFSPCVFTPSCEGACCEKVIRHEPHRRKGEHWQSADLVGADAEWRDERGEKAAELDPVARMTLVDAFMDGRMPGNNCYFTQCGIRPVFWLSEMVTDAKLYRAAARGAMTLTTQMLIELGLHCDGQGRNGMRADQTDLLSQFFYLPNAVVRGKRRESDVWCIRDEPYDPHELADLAPRVARPKTRNSSEMKLSPQYGERPGDHFNREADWASILEPHGWELIYVTAEGVGHWRRPGKKDGTSATTGYCTSSEGGHELFKVFTDSAPPFEPGGVYSAFTAYVLLRFEQITVDTTGEAASEIAAKGYGARKRGKPSRTVVIKAPRW